MLRCALSKITQPCHSEERSDEESAFVGEREQEADSSLRSESQAEGFSCFMGGPKAHAALRMTYHCERRAHASGSPLCMKMREALRSAAACCAFPQASLLAVRRCALSCGVTPRARSRDQSGSKLPHSRAPAQAAGTKIPAGKKVDSSPASSEVKMYTSTQTAGCAGQRRSGSGRTSRQ
jgi:hypothetical protein